MHEVILVRLNNHNPAAIVVPVGGIKGIRITSYNVCYTKLLRMIFFNSSLRTRLSTHKAAMNLGMNVMVLDINQGAWKLETERGVIMDGDKPEHLLEAIPVMGCYCDIIGVRSFARFEDREYDYNEVIINQFIRITSYNVCYTKLLRYG